MVTASLSHVITICQLVSDKQNQWEKLNSLSNSSHLLNDCVKNGCYIGSGPHHLITTSLSNQNSAPNFRLLVLLLYLYSINVTDKGIEQYTYQGHLCISSDPRFEIAILLFLNLPLSMTPEVELIFLPIIQTAPNGSYELLIKCSEL